MSDFVEKLKKNIEEGYDTVKMNASGLREIAEDFSKVAKLKFELYQLKTARDKKFNLLGTTVYPYLLEGNYTGLKGHETILMLLDEIKNLTNQVELLHHAIMDISARDKKEPKIQNKDDLKKEIERLEEQIEKHLSEIKAVKTALDKDK